MFGEWLFQRTGKIPIADGESFVTLATLSEKAAKFVTRLYSLQLSGVHTWLQELSRHDGELQLAPEQFNELRELLNIEVGDRNDKRWRVRLKRTPERWTPDHIYRVAGRRGVLQPAPATLDWAAALVWLVIEQGQIPSGVLPLPYLIYSAFALQHCVKLQQVDGDAANQPFAITALTDYLTQPRMLLNESQVSELRHYLKNEPAVLESNARGVSERVERLFQDWNLNYG